jgi:catechol 2,3-dioxygenase-like lactoylglutathione lyase family enzyme
MALTATTIMLSVQDVDRSKKFYADGLGAAVTQDYPGFALLSLGEGSSSLALYEREAAAREAGVPAEGSGFRGVSFHHIAPDRASVDDIMARAEASGAEISKPAEAAQWGGYSGYFSDPDGHLWKVACAS